MKKKTTKKAKSRTTSRAKPAAKSSSLSQKAKKKKTDRPAGKSGTSTPKVALAVESTRKSGGSAHSAVQTKLASRNGRQSAVEGPTDSKPRKSDRSTTRDADNGEPKKAAPPSPRSPVVKTYLSAKELKEFKAILLDKRAELAGDVENLTTHALNRKSGGVSDQSSMPIHMADLGSDTWEQDFTLGLIANEQAVVREIDEALERIENRTYGICAATDQPISRERLLAKPWAKYCIEYARLREEGRAP